MSIALSLLASWSGRAWQNVWRQPPNVGNGTHVQPLGRTMASDTCAQVKPRPLAAPYATRSRPTRPLRVLRVVDAQPSRIGAGRMVISGRMADVCAELDRLAAVEAAHRLAA